MSDPVAEIDRKAQEQCARLEPFYEQVARVIVGQRPLIDRLLIALLSGGHVLLEGVPGLAKTLLVRTAARALALSFARIQFTPDLLPADVIGTQVYHPRTGDFTVKSGPIFANVVLADEINRAPAKVQSALLEAMQELQVTLGESTHPLPRPFLVLATQNPIEHEGTYPLPEAQLDRFLFKLRLTYPSKAEESSIIDRMAGVDVSLDIDAVLSPSDLNELRHFLDTIYMAEEVKLYALDLVRATRTPAEYGLDVAPLIQYGASPRASLGLVRAARGLAFLAGRGYVTPSDVKQAAPDVLRHRVIISYEAEADGLDADAVVQRVLGGIAVP
ncbi:MAG: AAA family ATPase [Gemmataceae bacterium]